MFQMAFGLPDGTIRSALAIFIVIGALLTLIAAMANDLGFKVPDALAGVFGTILGFYFGRSGSVETAQASAAVTAASQATSDATKSVADAQVKTIEAQQALQASQDDQTDAVSGDTGAALEVITAIVNELPPPPNPNLQSQLTACANAIKDAKAQGDLTLLKSAYAQLMTSGPLATLLSQDLPGLSPFVTAGTSTLDCARALVSLSMRIRPAVAQLWVARLLRQPYRTELFTPVIDTAYANQLLGQVGDAGALLQPTKGPGATMTASDLVGAALSECGAQQIVDRWSLPISQVAPVVESLQQRAFEMELMKALSADDFKPFNGPSAFFTNLEKVQATPSGQQALDLLMLVLREARNAAVSAVDLLPQGT
jgi:hypothetical protein